MGKSGPRGGNVAPGMSWAVGWCKVDLMAPLQQGLALVGPLLPRAVQLGGGLGGVVPQLAGARSLRGGVALVPLCHLQGRNSQWAGSQQWAATSRQWARGGRRGAVGEGQ